MADEENKVEETATDTGAENTETNTEAENTESTEEATADTEETAE